MTANIEQSIFYVNVYIQWERIMIRKRRLYFNLFILSAVLFASFACKENNSKEVTVNFWGMGAEGEIVQKLIPEFTKEYPQIRVKTQMIPWTAAQEKLISAYAGKNLPDIFQLGNTWIPQFVALNALEDLDSWVNESTIIKKKKIF